MKFSLRFWFLSTAFLLVFVMSLLFTYSHHSMATLPYLDSGGLGSTHRVKLVPGYAGLQRLNKGSLLSKSCACRRCMGDTGASDWFDSHYDGNISPVWTKENMDLPLDVQRWWMMLQPQFKSHNTNEVLEKLFQIVPGENPYRFRDPHKCRRCAVVGNSGNLRGSGYGRDVDGHNFIMRMNQAPTVGFEQDVGSRTTHHFMYPESAKNLPANVSFVLVPFKALDLLWIASALSTGQIRFTYAPVKSFLRVDKEKVQIYNPAFFKYIHDRWTEHHGRYPSTGMLVLFFALHVCDEVNVYGFGADSRGNWHHYWENNRYAGEFRKTGVHDADFEAHIIDMLAKASKIEVYRGN
ncbi:CMP-N-acetylneuraminate-beta-galactosamide-alpha-2,3-sialyltransferase 2 [Dromiciops gliroides]|uniref:CMP-N-acetylneuraminate-beta-galactosamide- alpha-2,3-sialyltransferase 2 n=1 Tax=Dromiciops gliroides TaxID=33562 RepID=UPI001CC55475|nr:CMP-N-acetylneuraminate-beta-galactosamide-alpha-2,3-sialyltransferase 2 [Dromiciops gliroides]XP_043837563.1 CMP-N-acetylneuraminate-beta-galactosamide-alpha-2,3-sialyltransferase 2 [Dromiciops gliroides]XP_043837564.1 CMP-N-acetylneuraminate-beta-galactosamide-alpha-2,3-sialyltransferase 2 [Dromiciops gliroides]XP_043837565.1 CMP-N-acetylneuraminate-beta-galactosamide-alpha-2,3-sialyltransferase 2 [Dromiciops gliroides]